MTEDATEISCSQEVSGVYESGEGGYVSTYLSKPLSYSGPATWNLNGQEYMYKVFVDPGEFTVTLEHESDDLDVFVLSGSGDFLEPLTDCVGESCGMLCGDNPPGTHTVEVSAEENQNGGYYYVVVDAGANNSSTYTLVVNCQGLDVCTPVEPLVDLGFSSIVQNSVNGSEFDMVATVKNFGSAPATEEFTVSIFLNPIDEQYFCFCWSYFIDMEFVSNNLNPNETISIPFSADCDNRGIPPGEYGVVIMVNRYPFSYVPEIIPGIGNFTVLSEPVVVSPSSPAPDLIVSDYMQNFSEPVSESGVYTMSYKIENNGQGSFSGDVEVGMFFSKNNPAYDVDNGVLISEIVTISANLNPGEITDWFDVEFTVPDGLCPTENNFFCIYVDPNNLIDEGGSEQNTNCFSLDVGLSDIIPGCIYPSACNFDPSATQDDGSCEFPDGCTDSQASNFDPNADCDDGSCEYDCVADLSGDGAVNSADLLNLLSGFGCGPPNSCIDLNGDGSTTVADLIVLLSYFGESCD